MKGPLPEKDSTACISLDDVSSGLLSTLIYFDIFDYPLTLDEIRSNCHRTLSGEEAMEKALDGLIRNQLVFSVNGFFSLRNEPALAERRIEGNERARYFQKKAKRFSSLISRFPFVRSVCISGSLSKGYMGEDSDIDYFIVTKPGRLWVCRTLLIAFKKIFLLNSKKYFCVNYFVDEDNLVIPDKNLFTATEISFIQPMHNYQVYSQLIMENSWCRDYYPNKKIARDMQNLGFRNGPLKRALEWCLDGALGERFDNYFFRMTLNRWKKKFPGFDEQVFDLNMRSRRSVSKHHPQGFQFRVLDAFEKKKKEMEERFSIRIAG